MHTTRLLPVTLLFFALFQPRAATAQTLSPAPVPPAQDAGRNVVISGTVPDEAIKATLLTRLHGVYGADRVIDQITVGNVTTPPNWSMLVPTLINGNLKLISKGQLAVDGTTVSLKGEVVDDNVRSTIAGSISGALNPTYVVKNGLRINAPSQTLIDQALADRIIEFEHGSALLTPSAKTILDEIVLAMKKVNAKRYDVIGHTDNVGSPEHNLALSEARAISVRNYLVWKGIPAASVATSGMGADQPVASNDTSEGRRRNRRIEFRVGK